MPVYNCLMALSDDKVYILSPGGVINPDYGFIPTTDGTAAGFWQKAYGAWSKAAKRKVK